MGLKGLTEGFELGSDAKSVLTEIASTIPTVTAITWLNWILFRFLIILPLNYLLMINTFIFDFIGLPSCSRMVRGGGPGGPVPYRLYIDSGMVFLCLLSISPVAPIIAPSCLFYFLFAQPLLRRNLIFVYRPRFDGGGNRWPFIFRMCISSMIVGEILLTFQLILKQASGPAIVAGLSLGPTLLFEYEMRKRFLRSFEDAALCQTSMLDGWYEESEFTSSKREEFRRFLVDAHKAAYVCKKGNGWHLFCLVLLTLCLLFVQVPVCLASPETENFLTAEPAVVVPQAGEVPQTSESNIEQESQNPLYTNVSDESKNPFVVRQHGASLRRASLVLSSLNRVRTSASSENPNATKPSSFQSWAEWIDKVEESKDD
jgi:Calcium-dependent channel, 7TM region, putative phosphate